MVNCSILLSLSPLIFFDRLYSAKRMPLCHLSLQKPSMAEGGICQLEASNYSTKIYLEGLVANIDMRSTL